MRRFAVLGAIAVGALAAPLLASGTGSPVRLHLSELPASPVLGTVDSGQGFTAYGDSILTRLDPKSLLPVGKARLRFSPEIGDWAYSPDRSRLAVISGDRLFVVGTRPLRILSSAANSGFRRPDALGWVDGRVLVLTTTLPSALLKPFVFDPSTGRVHGLPGISAAFVAAGWAAHALVVLLSPEIGGIGACELARIPAEGEDETVPVPGTRCGSNVGEAHTGPGKAFMPGLAVDPTGDRAFIAPGASSIFEVDLRTMAAARHDLGRSSGSFASILGWLAPSAQAKSAPQGPVRYALWLGGGALAVWGADWNSSARATVVGVTLIDTRSWASQTLDAADWVLRDGDTLVTYGSHGVMVYGPDGSLRRRLFSGREVYADVGFGHAIVSPSANGQPTRSWVVDLSTGKILRSGPTTSMPGLLDADVTS